MTVSISPCWRRQPEPCQFRLLAVLALLCLCLAWPGAASAAERSLAFRYHEVVPVEHLYIVNASVALQANPRLREMVESGLSVPFQAEFALTRSRWYWLDETIVERSMNFRLAYHALTRQYRLSIGGIHRSFRTYDDALSAMLSIRNWAVVDSSRLVSGETYQAAMRLRLDVAQLPKPFQVAALGSRDLDLTTGWSRWSFAASDMDAE